MNNKKIAGVFFIIGLVVIGFYFLYMALPFLVGLTSNILYLGFFGILFIVIIVAIFSFGKRLFK